MKQKIGLGTAKSLFIVLAVVSGMALGQCGFLCFWSQVAVTRSFHVETSDVPVSETHVVPVGAMADAITMSVTIHGRGSVPTSPLVVVAA